jgi:hypothetical protein
MFLFYIVQKNQTYFSLRSQEEKTPKKDDPKSRVSETGAAEMSLQGEGSLG